MFPLWNIVFLFCSDLFWSSVRFIRRTYPSIKRILKGVWLKCQTNDIVRLNINAEQSRKICELNECQ